MRSIALATFAAGSGEHVVCTRPSLILDMRDEWNGRRLIVHGRGRADNPPVPQPSTGKPATVRAERALLNFAARDDLHTRHRHLLRGTVLGAGRRAVDFL